jgi:hypothetical protein
MATLEFGSSKSARRKLLHTSNILIIKNLCYFQFLLDVCQRKGWFLEFSYAFRKPKAPEIEDKGGITTLSNLLLGKGAPSKTVKLIQIRKSWPQNQTVPGENTPKNDRKMHFFNI